MAWIQHLHKPASHQSGLTNISQSVSQSVTKARQWSDLSPVKIALSLNREDLRIVGQFLTLSVPAYFGPLKTRGGGRSAPPPLGSNKVNFRSFAWTLHTIGFTKYTQTEKVNMLKVQIEVTRQTLRDETSLWNYPDQFFILNSTWLQNSIWKEILWIALWG